MRENDERWKELCELETTEEDPKKLIELTDQINDLLMFKQEWIEHRVPCQPEQRFFRKDGGA